MSRTREESREYMRAWRAANPMKYRVYVRKYREKNLQRCRKMISDWAKANPEKHPNYHLKNTYGITLAEKNAMIAAQGGCGICRRSDPDSKRGWQVDADHSVKPAKVRGILCVRCNTSIGKFNHDPELLQRAAEWIKR